MHRRIVGLLLCLLTLLLVPEARGAVRYVSKSGKDTNNPACTQAAPCGTIQHAVDIASPGDTINIGKGKFVESFGVSIAKDLTLNGAGIFSTRVGGTWTGFSVFQIQSGAVTITGLDVELGNANHGGGISNHGNLTLKWVRVRKNSATGRGGGIFNWSNGTLLMYQTEVAHNSASDGGGGLHNQGFAVLNEVLIVANHADLGSGGVSNSIGGDGEFSLIATRSLISHNAGSGIDNWAGMSLINTTVSRNHQMGIFTGDGGHTKLTHVTVADNGNGPDQHPDVSHGGLEGQPASQVDLINTIVANNAVAQCVLPPYAFVVSATSSLVSDGTCKLWPGNGNLVGIDPKLGPLIWSKVGSTITRRTHALKLGSPAIDAGAPGSCESEDQRGVSRPIDGDGDGEANCDIGAFEYTPLKRTWPIDFEPAGFSASSEGAR